MKTGFSRGLSLTVALCALTLSGCALLPAAKQPELQRSMGMLHKQGDNWVLQACVGWQRLDVLPGKALNQALEQTAAGGQGPIFVDLLGQRIGSGQLLPSEVLRLSTSGQGCITEQFAGNQWLAFSSQPAWQVAVSAQGMQWQDQQVPLISEQLTDGTQNFRSLRDRELELWIYPRPCIEPASGDYYHASATLIEEGVRSEGCAFKGGAF